MFPAFAHAAVTSDQERPELGGRQLAFAVGLVGLENTEKQLPHLAIDGERLAPARAVGALAAGPGRIGVVSHSVVQELWLPLVAVGKQPAAATAKGLAAAGCLSTAEAIVVPVQGWACRVHPTGGEPR